MIAKKNVWYKKKNKLFMKVVNPFMVKLVCKVTVLQMTI